VACILINVGMWFERFVIIATSLARSFLRAVELLLADAL